MKLLPSTSEESAPLMKTRNPRNWIPLFKRFVDEKVLGKFDAKHLKLLNAYLANSSEDEIMKELQEASVSSPRGPRPPAEDVDQNPEDKNVVGGFVRRLMLSCLVAVPINDFSGVYGDDLPNTKDHEKSLYDAVFATQ